MVRPAFVKAGVKAIDRLSVETMRLIARDLSIAPPDHCRRDERGDIVSTPPDELWTTGPRGTWQNGFEPLVVAMIAAEAIYLAEMCEYARTRHDAPGARPLHT